MAVDETRQRFPTTLRLFLGVTAFLAIVRIYSSFVAVHVDPVMDDGVTLWVNNILVPYGIAFPVLWAIIRGLPVLAVRSQPRKLTMTGFVRVVVLQSGLPVLAATTVVLGMRLLGLNDTDASVSHMQDHLFFTVFLLLAFNPLVEEIIFRKMILGRLQIWGTRYAVLVSSAIFALPHLFTQSLPVMFFTFVSGCIWGFVTVRTGTIVIAVLLHSLSNFSGVFLPMLLPESEIVDFLFFLTRVVVLPLLAIVVLVLGRKEKDFGLFR